MVPLADAGHQSLAARRVALGAAAGVSVQEPPPVVAREQAAEEYEPDNFDPIAVAPAMIEMAIRATSRPYSTDVAPASPRIKRG
jgi:hypothetical protein